MATATADYGTHDEGDAFHMVAGSCPNLDRGRYRLRGTVAWNHDGERYKRKITSKTVSRHRIC